MSIKSELKNIDTIEGLFTITPSDVNDLGANVTSAIYVGTSGDLAVVMADGSEVTIVDIAAGVFHRLRIKQVKASGTDALNIIGGR
jgi:hypothetical protein